MKRSFTLSGLRRARTILAAIILLLGHAKPPLQAAVEANLVANGTFQPGRSSPERPEFWITAGSPAIQQEVRIETDANGRRSARLECSRFVGDGPDAHVMLCQIGKVRTERGRWYQLSFEAKTADLKAGAVDVALVNTRIWENAGLADTFPAIGEWQHFDLVFRAGRDLSASDSRLQFWFRGVGTLWLRDVILTQTVERQVWLPQIATEGVTNWVPNSSFECGTANWGSYTWGLSGWAGNLYRLEGQLDDQGAEHGQHSLRLALSSSNAPVFWFDYYDPVRQPVRRILATNRGWFQVTPGQALTLSAFLRSDLSGIAAQLAAIEAPERRQHRAVLVSTNWERHAFTFVPSQPFLFVGVGLDLEASQRDAATLWVDAVQLERGDRASAYQPRKEVESFIAPEPASQLLTNWTAGTNLRLLAYNDSAMPAAVTGTATVSDFFDAATWHREVNLTVPPHSRSGLRWDGIGAHRQGFFRAHWATPTATNTVRFAHIQACPPETRDSPFGFNHAYPWDFLVELAGQAGVRWWRDWSAKWQTIEPERSQFDFTGPDAQIRRVQALGGEVEVLLPFPSTTWSTTAQAGEVARAAGDDAYLRARLPLSFPPRELSDFGRYAAEVVRHYRQAQPMPATSFQILNEPVYTDYALPKKFGFGLDHYLQLLESAHRAIKQVSPGATVVGGLSANLDSGFTHDFITRGGLAYLDVFDLHIYDPARPAETYEEPFAQLEALARAHGGPKPVWITEWGCYADDDPASLPQSVGDATMNRCRWADERAAAEHIVKFASVAFAHGVRKIFFHAGTAGMINGPDAGGVLFEYGGAPRKMLPAVAVFSRLVAVPDACVKIVAEGNARVYVFRTEGHLVAIAWRSEGKESRQVSDAAKVFDLMGNEVPPPNRRLQSTPVYILPPDPDRILQ